MPGISVLTGKIIQYYEMMRKPLIALFCTAVAYLPGFGTGIILSLKESTRRPESMDRLLRDYSLLPGWKKPIHGVLPVVPILGGVSEPLVEILRRDSRVIHAEPDYVVQAMSSPNDPLFKDQWALFNPDQSRADVRAKEAWKITTGKKKIVVAILDTGIEYDHPDLAGNLWRNPGEVPYNGVDDDGNGYPDDVFGWNFAEGNSNPMDRHMHGTMISGILGAVANNHTGISGLMHRVSLMAVKGLSDEGWGYTSDLIAGIYYAADNGAVIINASWGGGGPQKAMTDAIAYAAERNVLFVAAAGNFIRDNDKYPFYPASYDNDNIVSVGASNRFDRIASFSHTGRRTVDLFAPGDNVICTTLGGGYRFDSGTSISAPYVAGSLGLLMSVAPGAVYGDYINLLLQGVTPLDEMKEKCVSGGRLDAAGTLALRHTIFPRAETGRTYRGVLSVLTQMTAN